MTEQAIYAAVVAVAFVFGALGGRVFAVEAPNRLAAIFAASYIGAGIGLATSLPTGSLLSLVATLLSSEWEFSTLFDALDVTGNAVTRGIASGAAGGLLVSLIVVAGFNRWGRSQL
jgi:hypothetical protein